jgi:pantoate--beta-alanine ligase
MTLYKEATALKKEISRIRSLGKTIGFVPTMGALHSGHLSLVNLSKIESDITVCSIFINPTQFNDPSDFEKYPVTIDKDILLLESGGCDILFFPPVSEIYPSGTVPERYDLGDVEYVLEGKYRPGHFQGVCQVMHRLIDIINPDNLYLGQKDYQQCIVIKRLLELMKHKAKIKIADTFREETGLAMSSRNLRLNDEQRGTAAGISKMLSYIKTNYHDRPVATLEKYATNYLLNNGFQKVDYVSIVNAATLQPVDDIQKAENLVTLIAAFIGNVRLIDNVLLND